ncbi:putative trans-sialidase, Group V [Trypanosoma cruzi]|uniref:Trans-sialidase, putative n=2 Tax=Trypanosoma cruzi TaxID=5693 RepID=Q4DEZ7_TRYCC|nr:trans-sialidase, putative [Trypanosoma cruzi]EAN91099.1 trans-sialidase, putative [Trypanosoma cruzi]PWV14234.1 putative trans-sialidase, Group V [Trypanosoma cruzi]|eukprot:XP_812950.1 trans-sialidase [Trypanosoma cruzi strain CL Brener]
MLSRVAAVKAPRTHNRRRVTGSRGRRRKGRESEPQRPNMSRRVFTSAVLLLVVMMCCGSGAAATEGTSSASGFSPDKSFVWRDKNGGETVSSLRVPVLVEMDGDVFAVAEAQLKEGESNFTGIASELLEWTDEESKGELDATKLKTQVLEECPSDKKNCASHSEAQDASQSWTKVRVSRPTTVVQGSDIYMFAGTYSFEVTEGAAGSKAAATKWELLVAVGNVSNDESSGKKKICWKDTSVIPWTGFEKEHESLTGLIGGGGSGIQMEDGTLVFPVEGTKNGKTVSLIYSSATESGKLSKGMSADGCSDPSVVEWKDKLMMMTACGDGRRRVYESADKGDSWTEALGTLSRVWGNKKGVRSGFITARIEDRNVMLVTLPVYAKKEEKENVEKGELHLWLTDNTHIVDVGPASVEGDDVAASSLLYKSGDNNELIALYEKKKGGGDTPSPGMVSVRLTAQLNRVKEVLTTWKKVDERVSQLCTTLLAQKDPSAYTACSADKITDGLVGFLSGSFSEDTWRDEYLGVNATVEGGAAKATKTSDGVTFHGAWAEWPVGKQGENQLYHFANYNFTLVATVSIDKVPEEGDTPIPLMGVKMNDGKTVLLGLSYNNKEKKWQLLCGGGTKSEGLSSNWEPGKTKRHVVILQRNGNQGTAYVDGQRVGNEQCAFGNSESQEISHFYIGGDGENTAGDEDVSVTVTNVLLYNRPLDEAVITALHTESVTIPKLDHAKPEPRGTPSTPAGQQPSELGHLVGSSKVASGGVEGADPQIRGVNATALSSNLVNVSQENNSDASSMRGSGLLPSLLLLLGLWGLAAQ